MAAPNENPYLATARRLDEQFRFDARTVIFDTLNALVRAIEGRLQPLDQKLVDLDSVLDGLMASALQRMDETFTPLINEATARLTEFGAAFTASSTTSLTIGTGAKSLIIPVGQRESFVFGDFVAIRTVTGAQSMSAQVISYQRDIGQLNVNVVSFVGSGTFAEWGIYFSAAPNLAHEGRTDNPHQVTAEQIGVYTNEEIDAAFTDFSTAVSAQLSAMQTQITALQTSSDLTAVTNRISALETNMPIEDRKNRWIG